MNENCGPNKISLTKTVERFLKTVGKYISNDFSVKCKILCDVWQQTWLVQIIYGNGLDGRINRLIALFSSSQL
jgi:hypothetical protein